MTERRHNVRTGLLTLTASLVLHALVLTLWCGGPSPSSGPSQRQASSAANEPIEFDLVTESPPPESKPAPVPRPRSSTKTPGSSASSGTQGAEDSASPGSAGTDVPLSDAPTHSPFALLPSRRTADRLTGGDVPGEGSGTVGQTVVNGPGEEPDAQAVAEYTSEKLTRRLNAELRGDASAARVQSNTEPRYFSRVRQAMREELKLSPVELSEKRDPVRSGILDAVETWQLPAAEYGKTGSPATSPEDTRAVEESAFGRMLERGAHPSRDETTQREANAMAQSMAAINLMGKSARRPRLRTIVSMYQDWSGALADIRVIQTSTDPKFDEFVLHISRKVLREHGERDHDEADLPYREEGWSTEWQFTYEPPEVRVKLLRAVPGPPPLPY